MDDLRTCTIINVKHFRHFTVRDENNNLIHVDVIRALGNRFMNATGIGEGEAAKLLGKEVKLDLRNSLIYGENSEEGRGIYCIIEEL